MTSAPASQQREPHPYAISADGNRIAFATQVPGGASRETEIRVLDLGTGATTTIRHGANATGVTNPSLSADGRFVAYAQETQVPNRVPRRDLYVFDMRSGTPSLVAADQLDLAVDPHSDVEISGSLAAVDADVGDTFTYDLLDSAGGRFRVVGGQLVVDGAIPLDFEAARTHVVHVRVTDSEGHAFEKSLTVAVSDAAETTPVVRFALAGRTLGEGTSQEVVVNVWRSAPAPADLEIPVTLSGTATARPASGTAPFDYSLVGLSGPPFTLRVPAGHSGVSVSLALNDDAQPEGPETAVLTLMPAAGFTVGPLADFTLTIGDNDGGATVVSLGTSAFALEQHTGFASLPFVVQITAPAPMGGAVVLVTTAPGRGATGASGDDFRPLRNVPVTIAAGQLSATVTVRVVADTDLEPAETFFLELSLPPGSALALGTPARQSGTILNDDSLVTGTPLEKFIRQAYLRFLNHSATPADIAYWGPFISSDPVNGRQLFVRVLEATPPGRRVQLNRLYQQYLERDIDEGGLTFWAGLLGQGRVNLDQIGGFVISSPEFLQQVGGTAEAFADAVVRRATGRSRGVVDPVVTSALLESRPIDLTGDGRIDAADGNFTAGQLARFRYALEVNGGDGTRRGTSADQFTVAAYFALAGVPLGAAPFRFVSPLQGLFFYPYDEDVVAALIFALREEE